MAMIGCVGRRLRTALQAITARVPYGSSGV